MRVQIPTREGAILMAKRGRPRTCPDMSGAVDILKATQQGAASVRCGCRLGCTRWGAHWRHLTNITEPSVCSGATALCRITLTTCLRLPINSKHKSWDWNVTNAVIVTHLTHQSRIYSTPGDTVRFTNVETLSNTIVKAFSTFSGHFCASLSIKGHC